MRDVVVPRWTRCRVADKLERIVADDLWPLPKYSRSVHQVALRQTQKAYEKGGLRAALHTS